MISCKKYYYKIISNLQKNEVFYKYYNKTKTYKESLDYSFKILSLILKKKNNKNIYIYTYSNKSFEMYSSIFPILISGAKWIPLSTNYPIKTIENIIKQIKPDFLFFDNKNKKVKNLFLKNKAICINYKKVHKVNNKRINLNKLIDKIDIYKTAFIYFTSGSTGEPKGIKISHKNIISDIFEQKKHLYKNISSKLVFGDYYDTAFSIFFDIYFPAIFFGSILSPGIKKDELFLPISHIEKNQVNALVCVPSTIQRIKDYHGNENFKNKFKIIILTGEPFYLNLLNYIFNKFKFKKIFNCYGGTEMSNWVFFHACKRNDVDKYKKYNLVPIGKKFSSVKANIINNELVVKGPMISNGYLKNELNIGKFEFSKNNKFFTSDSVIKHNKVFICKGRIDNMIKIRGYRIELSEIEITLKKLNYIEQAVVFQKKSIKYDNYLITVVASRKKISTSKIRTDLSKFLPSYKIPKKIHIIKTLPLNNNGKIDRKNISKNFK